MRMVGTNEALVNRCKRKDARDRLLQSQICEYAICVALAKLQNVNVPLIVMSFSGEDRLECKT